MIFATRKTRRVHRQTNRRRRVSVIKLVELFQTRLQRLQVIRVGDGAVGFFANSSRVFAQPCSVPRVEDAGRHCWKMRMTDRKRGAELKRVADHAKSGIQYANGGGF